MAKTKTQAAAAANGEDVSGSSQVEPSLPLFYQRPVAVEKQRHAKACVREVREYGYAAKTNSVAVSALEIIEAAKFYPIVFTPGDSPTPLAILGLESSNLMVGENQRWREGYYVPAYVRQYPFILFEAKEQQKLVLCIDEAAAAFSAEPREDAQALFNADGSPSPMTNQALEYCTTYYRHHQMTRAFAQALVEHKLLAPYHSQITLDSGRKISLTGFQMIDERAFNALPDAVIQEFRQKGWLPFVYLALASGSNWRRLASLVKA